MVTVKWSDGREISFNAITQLCDGDNEPAMIEMREQAWISQD